MQYETAQRWTSFEKTMVLVMWERSALLQQRERDYVSASSTTKRMELTTMIT